MKEQKLVLQMVWVVKVENFIVSIDGIFITSVTLFLSFECNEWYQCQGISIFFTHHKYHCIPWFLAFSAYVVEEKIIYSNNIFFQKNGWYFHDKTNNNTQKLIPLTILRIMMNEFGMRENWIYGGRTLCRYL